MTLRLLAAIALTGVLAACGSGPNLRGLQPRLISEFNQHNAQFSAGESEFALIIAGVTLERPEDGEKADATVIWRRIDEETGAFGKFRRNKRDEVIATTRDVLFRTHDDRAAWSLHWVRPGTYAMDGGEISRGSLGLRASAELREGRRLAFAAAAGEIIFIGLSRIPFEEDPVVSLAQMSREDFNTVVERFRESAPDVEGDPSPAQFRLETVPCAEAFDPLDFYQHCK